MLVDEMGTGTAPEEGAALAVALLDEFRARRCLVLATTHHDRLKAYASTTPGVLNASVEFDEVRLAPTYRLRVGVPGGSSGIAIARRLGLPESDRRARQRADHARGARGRRADRLSASQPRRGRADAARTGGADAAAARRSGARCARSGSSGSGSASRNSSSALPRRSRRHEKRHGARARSGEGPRAARADRKADASDAWAQARSEARGEADAAVVAHLSESQADLGVVRAETVRPPALDELVPGVRVRVRGFCRARGAAAARRLERRSRGRAAAHEGAARGDHRDRRETTKKAVGDRGGASAAGTVTRTGGVTVRTARRRRCRGRNRRDQRDRLHGRRGHAPRGQISRQRGAGGQGRRCA